MYDSNKFGLGIFSLLMKENNIDLVTTFIETKLIANNIGIHRSHDLLNKIVDIIVHFGWILSIKSTVLLWILQAMESLDCDTTTMK